MSVKSKIEKYFKNKQNTDFTVLDDILKKYIDGDLDVILSKYEFTDTSIHPDITRRGNIVEIDLFYHNITVKFMVDDYELDYYIYAIDAPQEDFENSEITVKYDENFSFEGFLESIYTQMINHPWLRDISREVKTRKKYKKYESICLLCCAISIGLMFLYAFISGDSTINPYVGGLSLGGPLLLAIIFKIKSTK